MLDNPAGFQHTQPWDQNSSGTISGDTILSGPEFNARAFTLQGNDFHLLALPAGYTDSSAIAVNSRGDVVGDVSNSKDPMTRSIALWPILGSGQPVLLDAGVNGARAHDIHDDGTILLNSNSGPHLWRDGALQPLANPPGTKYSFANAIRNSRVVGQASDGTAEGTAGYVWLTPNDPQLLPGSWNALAINASGLIVGREPSTTISVRSLSRPCPP